MREQPSTLETTVYQLKITLKYISPPVWRRLLVLSDITLAQLHDIIQSAMGWEDYHLHLFETRDGQEFGLPDEEDGMFFGSRTIDEMGVKLNQLLIAAKDRLIYRYDFGDDWEHDIRLEKILPPDTGQRYPVCTGGKRATPPEDIGGAPGYELFLEALADPEHEEHDSFVEWIGGEWDAASCDIEIVNAKLHREDHLPS